MLATLWNPEGALRRWLRGVVYSDAALSTTLGYRLWLRRRHSIRGPRPGPVAPWRNRAMKSRREWVEATDQVHRLGLPRHPTREKHWDSLAMVACVLDEMPRQARVLDAGGVLFSVILPWLFLYGYRDLTAVDLSFTAAVRRGPIRYGPGDITKLGFADATFDVVICQSVLEHGVDVPAFLCEAGRVLRPGGLLLVSVDYWARPLDATAVRAIDPDYRVFDPGRIGALVATARGMGLAATGPVDVACHEPAVRWHAFDLAYTFMMLAFRKAA